MSWIEDVRAGLGRLRPTPRGLRRFGLGGGLALLALGLWILLRHRLGAAGPAVGGGAAALGLLLAGGGLLAPARLAPVHRGWMALALALGWCTSRLVLLAVFFLLLTPLALVARLVGKRFLELRPDRSATSHWVARPQDQRDDMTRMY